MVLGTCSLLKKVRSNYKILQSTIVSTHLYMGLFKAGDTTSCVSHPVPMGRLTIASFIIAIVGVCFGLAALVMTIINAVRISRMKRGIDNRNHNESETKVSYVANKIKDEPTTSAHCITHQYFIHQQSHHITHAYSQVSIIFQILMQSMGIALSSK